MTPGYLSAQCPWNRPRDDDAAAGTLETMHTALIGGEVRQATEKPSEAKGGGASPL